MAIDADKLEGFAARFVADLGLPSPRATWVIGHLLGLFQAGINLRGTIP